MLAIAFYSLWALVPASPKDPSSISYHEVDRAVHCTQIPKEMQQACTSHSGQSSPFRYASIESLGTCAILLDSTKRIECEETLLHESPYHARMEDIPPYEGGYRIFATAEQRDKNPKCTSCRVFAAFAVGFAVLSAGFVYSKILSGDQY